MLEQPFLLTTYNKAFQRTGWASGYEACQVTPTHNGIGAMTFTLPASHPRVPDLMAPGARVVAQYLELPEGDDVLMTGPVTKHTGQGPSDQAKVTFTVEDDYRILFRVLGWPNPTQDIFHQGYDDTADALGDYDRRTGPAETVAKAFVSANAVARLGLPITVAPNLGRGAAVDVSMRMHALPDRLLPAVEQAGIGMRVRQTSIGPSGGGLTFDCYVPTVRPRIISEDSGVLASYSWEQAGPANTDVITGGQGEGIDRDFVLLQDATRVTEWGQAWRGEVFRDARDVELGNTPLLTKRGQETLDEGAPTSGIKLTLAETDTFKYGRTMRVGDVVTIEIAQGVQVTDLLRSATLNHTADEGLVVTPAVGDPASTDTHDILIARAISNLAKAVRDLRSRS